MLVWLNEKLNECTVCTVCIPYQLLQPFLLQCLKLYCHGKLPTFCELSKRPPTCL